MHVQCFCCKKVVS